MTERKAYLRENSMPEGNKYAEEKQTRFQNQAPPPLRNKPDKAILHFVPAPALPI